MVEDRPISIDEAALERVIGVDNDVVKLIPSLNAMTNIVAERWLKLSGIEQQTMRVWAARLAPLEASLANSMNPFFDRFLESRRSRTGKDLARLRRSVQAFRAVVVKRMEEDYAETDRIFAGKTEELRSVFAEGKSYVASINRAKR